MIIEQLEQESGASGPLCVLINQDSFYKSLSHDVDASNYNFDHPGAHMDAGPLSPSFACFLSCRECESSTAFARFLSYHVYGSAGLQGYAHALWVC